VTGESVFTPLNGSTFGEALLMLIVDCAVLLGLGMYLELVLPKEFRLGVRSQETKKARSHYYLL
jgi:hypothetical protein